MPEIAWLYLDRAARADRPWQSIAEQVGAWADQRRCSLRDCVVLVPFAQLLAPARSAFARRAGWMPRVETTRTLAATLGPPPTSAFGEPTFDLAIDSMAVQQLLSRQAWGRAWRQRDPLGFEAGVDHLARTGHELARAAFGLDPDARPAYWAAVRERLAPIDGPGTHERRLARIAAEWAALAPPPSTDLLFALRPAGWIAVCAGGRDALTMNLLQAAVSATPCFVIDADQTANGPAVSGRDVEPAPLHAIANFVCTDFEEEAQTAAALVLRHLRRAQRPIALIAQDRLLIRRVRALLERAEVSVVDETGWKLSTTRAAASVMSLLHAVPPGALIDHLLDWLKTGVQWQTVGDVNAAIRSLEAHCRRHGVASVAGFAGLGVDARIHRLLDAVAVTLEPLRELSVAALRNWAGALNAGLFRCGALDALAHDDAGRQVLEVLRLWVHLDDWSTDPVLAGDASVTLPDFIRWVDAALESKTFLPRHDAPDQTQVVITPLVQAMLRPFSAVVCPGADDARLGAARAPRPLMSDADAVALGLVGVEEARAVERLAFGHLLDIGPVSLLRRRQDAGQPLGASALVDQLAARLRRGGRAFESEADPRAELTVAATPIEPSAPIAPGLLPTHLSASAYETLRECPYRFFARSMLRLREPDELERDLEKRDYGTWLHAVLFRFHASRTSPAPMAAEVARLLAQAQSCQREFALSDAEFLPFNASFRALAPRYVDWLHARDRQGLRWLHGEYAVALDSPQIPGLTLEGHIDRIDAFGEQAAGATQLIDYKTGNVDALKLRVKRPLEDTQLAFYAALLPRHLSASVQAGYLGLDSSKGIELIEHKNVARTAQVLLVNLATDVERLRNGAAMPALGEGQTCEHCEMRGLCRRDHWTPGTFE